MSKGDTPPIDRGVEGPPTETEQILLQGLVQLDALRARGDASAVRQFLVARPDVQALYDARQKIMKTGVLAPVVSETRPTPETVQEQELEKVHQKLVEAWNVAEDAAARARAGGTDETEERKVFEQSLMQTIGEKYAKDIRLQWFKSVYAIVEYKGRALVLVDCTQIDHTAPLFQKLYDCPPQPRRERYRLVRAATTDRHTLDEYLLTGKLNLYQLDEHEVTKGKVE